MAFVMTEKELLEDCMPSVWTPKSEETMESQSDLENKTTSPNPISSVRLTENEALKFQNLQLQRQILALQEGAIVADVKARTGIDIKNWGLDLSTSTAFKRDNNG